MFTSLAIDIILGRSDDYFYTVGGLFDIQDAIAGGDHITDIKILGRGTTQALLFVEVRLFSQIRTPKYHVVVGAIDFQNPQHVAIFEKHRMNSKLSNFPVT